MPYDYRCACGAHSTQPVTRDGPVQKYRCPKCGDAGEIGIHGLGDTLAHYLSDPPATREPRVLTVEAALAAEAALDRSLRRQLRLRDALRHG